MGAAEQVWYFQFQNMARTAGLVQAVSGRLGGVSEGHLRSLNIGLTVGDRREAVFANRRRLAMALAIPIERWVKPRMVHGSNCLVVGAAEADLGLGLVDKSSLEADALLTAEPEVYLFLTVADCVPVLLHDPVRGVVGLAHAGWKGTVAGVARKAVAKAQAVFGSRPADVLVGIGPSIGPCCYEVGAEVARAAARAFPGCKGLLHEKEGGRVHLDLWRANAYQLEEMGVPAANIEIAGLCTACRTDLFFSHRAEKGKTGRQGAIIGLRRS